VCWGDPCVQVSSNLVPYSSRIKLWKKGVNFEWKSCFQRTPSRQSLTLQDKVRNSWALCSPTADIVRPRVLARCPCTVLATVCYPYVRLTPFFYCCVRNFEWITSTLLVGVFITLLKSFKDGVWTWDIGCFLQKNLIRLPFTPLWSPPSVLQVRNGNYASLSPSGEKWKLLSAIITWLPKVVWPYFRSFFPNRQK
jgi:hypothetical protein